MPLGSGRLVASDGAVVPCEHVGVAGMDNGGLDGGGKDNEGGELDGAPGCVDGNGMLLPRLRKDIGATTADDDSELVVEERGLDSISDFFFRGTNDRKAGSLNAVSV